MIDHQDLHVEEFNSIEDLRPLRGVWRELLEATAGASFFQSYEWLETYWRFFGEKQKLRVMVVRRGGDPIGIVPLTVIGEATRIGSVRVLTYPLHDWGSFYAPVGAGELALQAALEHVRNTRRDWDLLDLRWVDKDADRGQTPAALTAAGYSAREAAWAHSPVIDIDGSWKDYLDGRTPKFRSALRRYEKKMAAHGELTLERHRASRPNEAHDPRWDLYDACVEIAANSWQGASTTGTTLSHGTVRDYLRATHEAAAKFGAVDVSVLRLDGKPIGFCYNYFHAGCSYGLRKGNFSEFSRDGASMVLAARVLEDSFTRGDRLYNMGPGSIELKDRWMTRVATGHRYTHYPKTAPKAQILRLKHWWRGKSEGERGCVSPTVSSSEVGEQKSEESSCV